MVERVLQIAEACAMDMLEYDSLLRKDSQGRQVHKQPNSFMDNIFYFRICTYTEQIAVVNYLEKFINEHKDVSIANRVVFQLLALDGFHQGNLTVFAGQGCHYR